MRKSTTTERKAGLRPSEPEPPPPQARVKALDAFLVDNPDLERLSARLAQFNIFRVLSIERAEIRHSNVLAWLLNPRAEHGLGPNVLRRFLSRLLMANEGVAVSLTPARVELMDFSDVEVQREWKALDILVRSPKGKWCLGIENKVGAGERAGQLSRYRSAILEEYPQDDVVPVLLTLDGEDPSEEGREAGYVAWSHASVLELVEETFQQNRSKVPADAAVLLEHYLDTLRRLTMQDTELVRLCKDIYRKHREAIDLINEYGTASRVLDAGEQWVKRTKGLQWLATNSRRVWFVHDDMVQVMREVGGSWPFLPKRFPMSWWFYHNPPSPRIQLTLEVGPVADAQLRQRILRAVQGGGFKFWEGGLEAGARYTRILTEKAKLPVNEEGEVTSDDKEIEAVVGPLWERTWKDGKKIVDVLRKVEWEGGR